MSKPRVSLCLLTYNERQGCERDVPSIPTEGFHEVFCVDGNSKDGTIEYMKERGITVHIQPKRGLCAGYAHAVRVSTGDALVVFFPKGTLSVELITTLRETLEEGHQLVAASRNMPGAGNKEDSKWFRPRKWFVRLLGKFVSLVWQREGTFLTDILHGVKGFDKQSYLDMNIEEEGMTIDLAMAMRSYKLRHSRVEIPAFENPRFYGDTHFTAAAGGSELVFFLLKELFGLNPGQNVPGVKF
ncbi:MAG: glycosyl transferase family 2 [Elusimicrobia bacterium]|nr:MAG: glycosyl transferase family 2 [Elusimicrobiota bacterium]